MSLHSKSSDHPGTSNVLIIHGAYGSPCENWYRWLGGELEKSGARVFRPEFPTPDNQSLENWMDVFKGYETKLDENSIVVGHSLGVAFLLYVIEKLGHPIRAAFFVSGFITPLNNANYDVINESFMNLKFDWNKIIQNCKKFYIIHSDNDPYVPLKKAEEISRNLDINTKIIANAGHFNTESGYYKFESLFRMIKEQL